MINSLWLEEACIVQNASLDRLDEDPFSDHDTDIELVRYRNFVSSNPQRVSYFQSALDAIKYSFGPLIPGRNVVVLEGKFDFHSLKYFQQKYKLEHFMIIPAPSASEAGTLISMFCGIGSNFLVMLDDDAEGRRSAQRYRMDHLLTDAQVFTLASIDEQSRGKANENFYGKKYANYLKLKKLDRRTKVNAHCCFKNCYC